MKTPMQQAIDKVQSLKKIDAVINPIDVITSILTGMLKKEKEVIMDAYKQGVVDEYGDTLDSRTITEAEVYYNATFNTKEK